MKLVWRIVFGLGWMIPAIMPAQEENLIFRRVGQDAGMSHTSVYSIIKDRRGILWFASDNGLVKFDGYQVYYFEHDPNDSFSLADNTLSYLAEDTSGGIWVATWGGGLDFFDPRTGRFRHYKNNPNDPSSLGDNRLHVVFQDSRGNTWIGGYSGGLQKWDMQEQKFIRYLPDNQKTNSISHTRVWSICEMPAGVLWIGTENGLNRFDIDQKKFTVYQYSRKNKKSISHNRVRCVSPASGGKLWVGTQDGLNLFDPQTGEARRFFKTKKANSLSHDVINTVYEESNGNIWIGTEGGGLNRLTFAPGKKKGQMIEIFTHFKHNPKDLSSITDNNIRNLLYDNAGLLWIATRGGGVNLLDLKPKKFIHFYYDPLRKNTLNYNRVFALLEEDQVLWIGTDGGGLNRYDLKTEKFSYYTHNPKDKKSIPDNRIRSICSDREGNLWIGTYTNGLARFNKRKKTFTHYRHEPEQTGSLSHNTVSAVIVDRRGYLWAGTDNGLNVLPPNEKRFIRLPLQSSNNGGLPDNRILSLMEDQAGHIWAGTENKGVTKIEINGNRVELSKLRYTNYRHDPSSELSLTHNRVFFCYQDKNKNIWIGTSGGLNQLDASSSRITQYTENEGLPSNVIRGILEDKAGNLWISTNRGISRYNPQQNTFRNYDVHDGLQSNEFNEGACYKGSSGFLYFGGIHGFNRFIPDSIRDNAVIPSVVITGFRKFGKTVKLIPDISFAESVVLDYHENVFSFEFSALEYTNPLKNQYAYQLVGFDPDWVYSGNTRTATYTNIDPNKYIFRVKGSNHDGIWNEEGTSIQVIITPPFWDRWWFRALVLVLIIGIVSGAVRWRIRRIKAHNQELEDLVTKRTAELKQKNAEVLATLESLRQTRDQLIQAEKMSSLGQMVAGIAHEINTPRATVDHYVFIMNRKIAETLQRNDPKQVQALFKNMVEEILPSVKLANERIGEIVDGLLNFTRSDLSEFRPADIHQIINSVLIILKNMYKGRIEIIREFGQIPPIECYPGQLSQLFMNIILNAIEAIPAGGYIRITTEMTHENRNVRVRVKDTGTGMPEEVKMKIFDPFFTTKELGKGKGLGLSVAYSIVTNHQGKIEFESALGEGTEFMIYLPVKQIF